MMSGLGSAIQAKTGPYILPDVFLDDRVQEIPAGSNLLVTSPPLMGKAPLVYQILSRGRELEQPSIIVTSERSAAQVLSGYRSAAGISDSEELSDVYVVDCSGTTTQRFEDEPTVKYVSSPGDLTGVGIGIAKCIRELESRAEQGLRIGLLSLSTLLQYADARRVFNFTHVMTGRIAAADYLGVWTIHSGTHDEQTLNTLKAQFNYVAELRETEEGQRQLRVLGGPDEWRTWKPL